MDGWAGELTFRGPAVFSRQSFIRRGAGSIIQVRYKFP